MQQHLVLSVLFFEDRPGVWVAQALERDIAAYGLSMEDAKVAFERTVFGYLHVDAMHKRIPLTTLRPAPTEFWDAWERARSAKMQAEALNSGDPAAPPAYMISAITSERPNTSAQ